MRIVSMEPLCTYKTKGKKKTSILITLRKKASKNYSQSIPMDIIIYFENSRVIFFILVSCNKDMVEVTFKMQHIFEKLRSY